MTMKPMAMLVRNQTHFTSPSMWDFMSRLLESKAIQLLVSRPTR